MNERIKNHLIEVAKKNGWKTDDDMLIDMVIEGNSVWSGDEQERRWWTDFFNVVDIDGMFIGFWDAKTTGDDSAWDKGWEFDPSTIIEVKPVTKTVTITEYVPV